MVNSLSPTFRLAAAMLSALLVITSSVHAAKIDIKNQCSYDITACDEDPICGCVTCYVLTGGSQSLVQIDVGATWQGTIWGLPSSLGDGSLGYQAIVQANRAEVSINVSDSTDFYDLTNVDAYNLPLMIKSTVTGGNPCPSINCTISNLTSFCQPPNSLTGAPGFGCKNAHGPSETATNGTRAFKSRCPGAYSYSYDDSGATIGSCKTGSNYEVVFCP